MNDISNPYRINEPVTDPTMLFGRRDALDWLERQLNNNNRTLVVSGSPLIGKSSLIRNVGSFHNLELINLVVALYLPTGEEHQRGEDQAAVNVISRLVVEQLTIQLRLLGFISIQPPISNDQPTLRLRELIAEVHRQLGSTLLVIYFDDLHLLINDSQALIASFLTTLNTLLDDCPQLHFVFTINHNQLQRIRHPLVNRAPTFHLSILPTDASINMVTLPVRTILRFDYGVSRRISEINSHHPYYLTLFCHNLLNRQMYDGWVNQRDFDAVLAETLATPIEPFRYMWDESSWAERAVLVGMSTIQGTHGPLTRQEVSRYLHKKYSVVSDGVVRDSLEALAERGVLISMGHVSNRVYRFHVELLRFWLRENTDLDGIVHRVNWQHQTPAKLPPSATSGRQSRRIPLIPPLFRWVAVSVVVLLCTFVAGGVFIAQSLGVPVTAFLIDPTPTATPTLDNLDSMDSMDSIPADEQATPTVTTVPPTLTPVPVKLVTLPALAFMGRDIGQGWQIYTMNANGSEIIAISVEDTDDRGPVWSPNGQKIAFINPSEGNREIYLMDANGKNRINLTRNSADDWTPAWSPDGRQLIFSSIRTGRWEIFVMDMACLDEPDSCSSRVRQLTDDGNNNVSPVWSADGSRIAYNSRAAGNWDIYTMSPGGGDLRRITFSEANELAPAWSPDGSLIAFESDANGDVDIFVVDSNGNVPPRNITHYSQANDHGPTWSPDGQQIVFYANREGNWDIYSTTLDGTTVTNLTKTAVRDEQTPSWRP